MTAIDTTGGIGTPSEAGGLKIGASPFRVVGLAGRPTASLRLWLRGGSRSESVPGSAWTTGRMLLEGTRRRDWQTIAREADDRGMMVSSFGALECHGLQIDCLAVDWRLAVEWAAELTRESMFDEAREAWVEQQRQAELDSLRDQPDSVAAWASAQQCAGEHAAGRPAAGHLTVPSRVGPDTCSEFHLRGLAQGAVLSLVGGFDESDALGTLADTFGDAAGGVASVVDVKAPSPCDEARRTIPVPGDQAHLILSHSTVRLGDPDHPALELLSVILGSGSGLNGRIPWRLREREGLAYAAQATALSRAGLDPGRLVISVGTSPDRIDRAEKAARSELERLLEGGVTAEEVDEARSYLIGREPFRRETPRQLADLLARSEFYGLPFDRPTWLADALRDLDPEAVLEVARRHLRPEELLTTVGLPDPSVSARTEPSE